MTSVLLEEKEAAKRLHLACGTLRVWRCERKYPLAFVKIGARVFYREEDIQKFIEARTDPGVTPAPAKKRKRVAA